jgi:uncharacterized membrane protein YeaQ/YmgE (transglycosylase-associated protein family)
MRFTFSHNIRVFQSQHQTADKRKERRMIINFIIWIVMGAVIGWLASLIMGTNAQQGLLLDIVVGIVGSLLGGWLLAPLFGVASDLTTFNIASLLIALLGAIILLAIVKLFRRA